MDKSSNFFTGQPVFKQLTDLISERDVHRIAKIYRTDRYVKKLTTHKHLLAMLYGILSDSYSLRELVLGGAVKAKQMCHLGMNFGIRRSTLSDANAKRDSSVFGAIYSSLYERNRHFLSDSRLRNWRPVKNLFAFDSTTITLFSDVLKGCDKEYGKGSKQGRRKGGIKVHAMMRVSEGVPCLARLNAAAASDSKFMGEMKSLAPGSMVTFDKGYSNHDMLEEMSRLGIFYTTRLKDNVNYEASETLLQASRAPGVVKDERVGLSMRRKKKKHEARRIEYIAPEDGKKFVFLTNNFKLKAGTVASIYRKRWSIELMFKKVKQNFQLKYFYGDSANAIETQVWCTLIACLLMTLFKAINKIEKMSFSNMMFVTRCVLMEYVLLSRMLAEPENALMEILEKQNRGQAPPTLFG